MSRDVRGRDAGNRNGDVEGQVRAVGIRGRHAALNAGSRAGGSRQEQLNLTKVANRASWDGGTDGLAHVTEEGRVRRIGGGGESSLERTRRRGHDTSGVVANSAGRWDELEGSSRGGGEDVGGAVVGVVGLNLANETGNG